MTLQERADAYAAAFPECPGSVWVAGGARRWLYGHWSIGNDYTNPTRYYGAFPKSFMARVAALFPDIAAEDTLHAFSGSFPKGAYTRIDSNPELEPEIVGSVYDLPQLTARRFRLVVADPPYSATDAIEYGTAGVNRGRAMAAIAEVVEPGGHVVWLDTAWPMHRKQQWNYYGSIALVRSTNHRVRAVSLFERTST